EAPAARPRGAAFRGLARALATAVPHPLARARGGGSGGGRRGDRAAPPPDHRAPRLRRALATIDSPQRRKQPVRSGLRRQESRTWIAMRPRGAVAARGRGGELVRDIEGGAAFADVAVDLVPVLLGVAVGVVLERLLAFELHAD